MAAKNEGRSDVGFLYRTMVERDPDKRRVKPVESHMMQLDFGGLDDSEDDSDFTIGDHKDQDLSGSEGNISSESDSNDEDEDENESESDNKSEPLEKLDVTKHSVGDLIEQAKKKQAQARQRIALNTDDKLQIKICCICLGDMSEEDDEIVDCDNCGVSVHEGCYGISDCESVSSSASSASTEPWFCDACKGGKTNLTCELCPNTGGIFKETDIGRWVHLVCALYIPGVAFGAVEQLSSVTLFEMPYNKWGSKVCCLCQDDRFSRTGICIACDAGMCRTFFHVTCAQREGLLSEASPDVEIADPFFAHCKLHAEKVTVRFKKNNWLALQSQTRHKSDGYNNMPAEEKLRIMRKLKDHQEKYKFSKKKASQPWVPTQKIPRSLTSSPSACKRLIKKAELMGINNQNLHIPIDSKMLDVRRKWHIPPAFNIDFVCYYLDRNERMSTMKEKMDDLLEQNNLLQNKEKDLRKQYEDMSAEYQNFRTLNAKLKENGVELYEILKSISRKKLKVPELFFQKKVVNQSNKKASPKSLRKSGINQLIMQCESCQQSHDQHQMAKCDKCQLHYHLSCLDPPLTRMPKKTKLQGWQCSECDKTEEANESDSNSIDPNAPRSLRKHLKPPAKYFRSLSAENSIQVEKKRKRRKRTIQGKQSIVKKMKPLAKKVKETPAPLPVKGTITRRRSSQISTSESSRSDCSKCGESCDTSSAVRCDSCDQYFHFKCLNPPVKKSPRIKGYLWLCEECTP